MTSNTRENETLIHEINQIHDILKACHFNSYVVFDLDNTVIQPFDDDVGSDQWFDSLFQLAVKHQLQNENVQANIQLALCLYREIQSCIKMQAVEPAVIKIIKHLQMINIPVLAVTSRGYDLAECTRGQLNEIGINFATNWTVAESSLGAGKTDQAPFYSQGIIYCAGNNKGDCMEAFFSRTNCVPKNVVMTDDKLRNLLDVQDKLKKYHLNFVGMRYGFLDKTIEAYQLAKTFVSAERFLSRLSSDGKHSFYRLQQMLFFSNHLNRASQAQVNPAKIEEKSVLSL